jgi:hypothetical protein
MASAGRGREQPAPKILADVVEPIARASKGDVAIGPDEILTRRSVADAEPLERLGTRVDEGARSTLAAEVVRSQRARVSGQETIERLLVPSIRGAAEQEVKRRRG